MKSSVKIAAGYAKLSFVSEVVIVRFSKVAAVTVDPSVEQEWILKPWAGMGTWFTVGCKSCY